MSNEENIEPSQVKSVHVEENQGRICFSSEPALNDQNTNENVDNKLSVTPKTKMNSPKHSPVIEEEHIGTFYAIVCPKPKAYYWGKLMKVFSHDIEDNKTEAEINFL